MILYPNTAFGILIRPLSLFGFASLSLSPIHGGEGLRERGTVFSLLKLLLVGLADHLFDILRRPALNLHTKMQAHIRQHFLNLVQ